MAAASPAPCSGRLPASRRIKTGRDFARARAQGRRLVQGCLIMNWLPSVHSSPNAAIGSRLGVITSRKVGSAVVRARSRRLLREAFRRHQHELARAVDLILVARPSIAGKAYASVERDYLLALERCGLRTTPGAPAAGASRASEGGSPLGWSEPSRPGDASCTS